MNKTVFTLAIIIILGLTFAGCQENEVDINEISATAIPDKLMDTSSIASNPINNDINNNNNQVLKTNDDNNVIVAQITQGPISANLKPEVTATNSINLPIGENNADMIENNNKDLPAAKPFIEEPEDWIEPTFEIIRGEIGGYYRIAIKNKSAYLNKNFEMRAVCISHPFNESLRYQIDGKEIIFDNTFWKPVDGKYFLAYLCKANYALPENVEKFSITKGMEISYIISIRKSDFVKDYPISLTVE